VIGCVRAAWGWMGACPLPCWHGAQRQRPSDSLWPRLGGAGHAQSGSGRRMTSDRSYRAVGTHGHVCNDEAFEDASDRDQAFRKTVVFGLAGGTLR
jgi:hypothetical protein